MSANPTAAANAFAAERTRLLGIAYRMLGSRADAEDVLQDAWLRWSEADSTDVRSTQAWLTTIVTRLSIDRLRSAKAQREVYIGPWLPEPLADIDPVTPESKAELASELSLAFLNLLERLGPDERAAFVLHDAFDCDYDDIAEVLGKSPAACRQLVHRARERVIAERRRFEVDEQTRRRMLERFIEVANAGDLPATESTVRHGRSPGLRRWWQGSGRAPCSAWRRAHRSAVQDDLPTCRAGSGRTAHRAGERRAGCGHIVRGQVALGHDHRHRRSAHLRVLLGGQSGQARRVPAGRMSFYAGLSSPASSLV